MVVEEELFGVVSGVSLALVQVGLGRTPVAWLPADLLPQYIFLWQKWRVVVQFVVRSITGSVNSRQITANVFSATSRGRQAYVCVRIDVLTRAAGPQRSLGKLAMH